MKKASNFGQNTSWLSRNSFHLFKKLSLLAAFLIYKFINIYLNYDKIWI